MKTKILMTILPSLIGVMDVLGALFIFNLIFGNKIVLGSKDIQFFTIFVPLSILCSIVIQNLLTLRIWERFKSQSYFMGMTLFQFTSLIIVVGGIIFGLVFWEKRDGVSELIMLTITGIVAFAIYWATNFMILRKIEQDEIR